MVKSSLLREAESVNKRVSGVQQVSDFSDCPERLAVIIVVKVAVRVLGHASETEYVCVFKFLT